MIVYSQHTEGNIELSVSTLHLGNLASKVEVKGEVGYHPPPSWCGEVEFKDLLNPGSTCVRRVGSSSEQFHNHI